MEGLLVNEVLRTAVKELLGYGVLGILVMVLGYSYFRSQRQLIAVLERKGKKTDKQTEIQAKLLDGNLEMSRTLMDIAMAQTEMTNKLLTIYKILAAKKSVSKSLLELGKETHHVEEEE